MLITSTAIIERHPAGIENLMKNLDVLLSRAPGFGRLLTAPDTVADGEENDNEEDEEEQEEEEETEEEDEEEDDFIQSLNGKKQTCPTY